MHLFICSLRLALDLNVLSQCWQRKLSPSMCISVCSTAMALHLKIFPHGRQIYFPSGCLSIFSSILLSSSSMLNLDPDVDSTMISFLLSFYYFEIPINFCSLWIHFLVNSIVFNKLFIYL